MKNRRWLDEESEEKNVILVAMPFPLTLQSDLRWGGEREGKGKKRDEGESKR